MRSEHEDLKPPVGGAAVNTWTKGLVSVLVLLFAAALVVAEGDDNKPGVGHGRIRNVWGRVEDINKTKTKLALKVETEEGDEIQIYKLTEDTKVRKAEHVKSIKDLTKGITVIVFYRPKNDNEKYPTAVVIRIRDDWRRGPKPRRRLRP